MVDLTTAAALALVVSAVHATNRSLEGYERAQRPPWDVGALPDGRAVRVLALGHERLAADLFWLRTAYYIGDEDVAAAGYPDAERLGELVTDIDPHFRTAYVLMNSVLTVLKHSPDAAIALLDKGIEHEGSYWKLHFLQGFTLFYEKGDYARAAEHIRTAFRLGGPPYLQLLATRLYAQAGDPETAMAFVSARMRVASNPKVRKRLRRRFEALWVERDMGRLERAIEAYRSRVGASPRRVSDLVEAGLLGEEPRDPRGGAYRLQDGKVVRPRGFDRLQVHRPGVTS